jgi:O-antigen/teichoic acid export membrane protein
MATWQRHRDLLSNSGSLVATTAVSSLLGFAFWAVAARLYDQQAVGYGSAAVSAMTLIGTIGMFGLGTFLIGELARRRARGGLVSAALIASGLGSLVLGLGFAILAPHFSGRLEETGGRPDRMAIFAVGVALTGATLVFDEATIGLLRGGLQLSRNAAFAVAKLLALLAVPLVLRGELGVGIMLAWTVGTAASMVPVAIRLRLTGVRVIHRPDWAVLRGLGKTVAAHNWLNLSIAVPITVMPVLVTVVVSASANAAFYPAWMLKNFLYTVPWACAMVLFAVAAATPQLIAEKLRFVLKLSLVFGLPAMAVLIVGAGPLLSLFGASYAREATWPMQLLVLSYLPALPKILYIAVCRADGKITRAAVVLTIFAAAEIIAAVIGGIVGGLTGVAFLYLVVSIVEGAVTAPAVIRTAAGSKRDRRAKAGPGAIRDPVPTGQIAGSATSAVPMLAAPEPKGLARPNDDRRHVSDT